MDHADVLAGLRAAYGETIRFAKSLSGEDFRRPTRCRGWIVQDLLFHQLLDAQRLLMALATPEPGPPDVDAVTYWGAYPGRAGGEPTLHAGFATKSAAAYSRPEVLAGHLAETAGAALRAAEAADPASRIGTQGHVLTLSDLIATVVLEAVVHRLDQPFPHTTEPAAMAVTEPVLAALLGSPRPRGISPDRFVLLTTGREAPDAEELDLLGPAAARLPVLG